MGRDLSLVGISKLDLRKLEGLSGKGEAKREVSILKGGSLKGRKVESIEVICERLIMLLIGWKTLEKDGLDCLRIDTGLFCVCVDSLCIMVTISPFFSLTFSRLCMYPLTPVFRLVRHAG